MMNVTTSFLCFLGILREALKSENHFDKVTAFWANEIADGINHLAINDSNKVQFFTSY